MQNNNSKLKKDEIIVRAIKTEKELKNAWQFYWDNLGFKSPQSPRNFDYYLKQLNQSPSLMFYAEDKGKMVGIVFGSIENDHMLVGEVVVLPEYRRKGIGSLLLSSLEEGAKQCGQSTLLLGALQTAQGFYLKNSYQPKLFIELIGKQSRKRLDNFLSILPKENIVTWRKDDGETSKAIVYTERVDKELQERVEKELKGCGTQYLFEKKLS